MSQVTFSPRCDILSVGMVIFDGHVDIRSLIDNDMQEKQSHGSMNKNEDILTCFSSSISLIGENGVTNNVVITLYAARLDVTVRKRKLCKNAVVVNISDSLDRIGCKYVCNTKNASSSFTITLYNFGSASSLENLVSVVNNGLIDSMDAMEGVLKPHQVKMHITGCREDENIKRACEKFVSRYDQYMDNIQLAGVYSVMHMVTYNIGRCLRLKQFVKYLTSSSLAQSILGKVAILYDNSLKYDAVTLMWCLTPDEVTVQAGMGVWRNNYDVYITVKQTGKIDQCSFSAQQDELLGEKMRRLFDSVPSDVFID